MSHNKGRTAFDDFHEGRLEHLHCSDDRGIHFHPDGMDPFSDSRQSQIFGFASLNVHLGYFSSSQIPGLPVEEKPCDQWPYAICLSDPLHIHLIEEHGRGLFRFPACAHCTKVLSWSIHIYDWA